MDEEVKEARNVALLRAAMTLLYDTVSLNREMSNKRAEAILAIDAIIIGHGAESFVPRMEANV